VNAGEISNSSLLNSIPVVPVVVREILEDYTVISNDVAASLSSAFKRGVTVVLTRRAIFGQNGLNVAETS
jgi:hypothetical protein